MTASVVAPAVTAPAFAVEDVVLGYGARPAVENITFVVPRGSFTVLIGPNASGKSTTLKALARLLAPRSGRVLLDGQDARALRPKQYARRVAMLPQAPLAPPNVTVADLVLRGRAPHQSILRQYTRNDEHEVAEALRLTGTEDLATRSLDELSGGQRQRVWIAVALAQQTSILLLDEPTTYLDLAHQIEILDLCARLHADGRTIVAVLHDLNLAARYATELIAFRDGRIAAQGDVDTVLTAEIVHDVFGLASHVIRDPQTGTPMVVPDAPPHRRLAERRKDHTRS